MRPGPPDPGAWLRSLRGSRSGSLALATGVGSDRPSRLTPARVPVVDRPRTPATRPTTPATAPTGPAPASRPTVPAGPSTAPPPGPGPAPMAAPAPAPAPAWIGVRYQRGDRSESLRRWQRRMLDRGVPIDVTGHFDDSTLAQVRRLQERAGLPVTGVIGARTWAAAWTLA